MKKKRFEVEVYKTVFNNAFGTLNDRYMNNRCIIQDASFLDPRIYQMKKPEFMFPEKSMANIANLARVDVVVVQRQLIEFAQNYDAITHVCLISNSQYSTFEDEISDNEEDSEKELKCAVNKLKCKSCISCAFEFLYSLVIHTTDYNELYTTYKLVTTLAFTQVTCE
ncbi:uncharacterized protein LOC126909060 [Daktulosphaira vitifoliae]|uniref:uncharacterized protein LOC126909060 n=1 Tax=Daktulosphaira vitifoliae TaxID=58002 RepID=UPI0021A9838F|nr:uncharacterized protein LOC126909060 [Daktulosphaira vitifoliae]